MGSVPVWPSKAQSALFSPWIITAPARSSTTAPYCCSALNTIRANGVSPAGIGVLAGILNQVPSDGLPGCEPQSVRSAGAVYPLHVSICMAMAWLIWPEATSASVIVVAR